MLFLVRGKTFSPFTKIRRCTARNGTVCTIGFINYPPKFPQPHRICSYLSKYKVKHHQLA